MQSKKPTRKNWLAAAILLLFLVLLQVFLRNREPEFSYIREKARELKFEREAILGYVREGLEEQDYPGSFRGALGTLWGESGNSLDRVCLLSELFSSAGIENEIVREGERLGVRLEGTGEVIPLFKTDRLQNAEPVDEKPDFSFAFLVGSQEAQDPYSGRVAEHLRAPLRVSVREGSARLIGSSGEILRKVELERGARLVIKIDFQLSGKKVETVRRELIPGNGSGSGLDSEHAVVFAPCEIDRATFEKQVELWREEHGGSDAIRNAYELALSHWYRSDLSLEDLRNHFESEAFYSVPRILIGSSYSRVGSDMVMRQALDLRLNQVSIPGNGEIASKFVITRAALEAELEAQVMAEATGSRGTSAIEVFLGHLGDLPESSSKRIAGYEDTLKAFLRDTYPGARLILSLDGAPALQMIHLAGKEGVRIIPGEPLVKKMRELGKLPWSFLGKGSADPENFSELSYEIEALLGAMSDRNVDYVPDFAVEESSEILTTPSVRMFSYRFDEESGKSTVSFEQQITQFESDGGYRYEIADYWDEVNRKRHSLRYPLTVPGTTYSSGRGFSYWHEHQTIAKGCNPLAMGTEVFRELKENGYAEVVPYFYDKSAGEPMKLYNLGIKELEIQINQEKVSARAMWVGGGPAAENLPKQAWDELEPVDDPSTPYLEYCNRLLVLDNPELPLYLRDSIQFQASIPGTVVSELSSKGIEGARIAIEGTDSAATSWPTGHFVLPIIKKPFEVFTVRITHPDFEPWQEQLDFRNLETFERMDRIVLKPKIQEDKLVWVESGNLEEGLALLPNKRTRQFVREALEDDPSLQALVPREDINHGFGKTHSWLLFDRDTHHITAVTEDGLHGAVGGAAREAVGTSVSAYSGFISSWYVYSGGKLDALTGAMTGGDFSDLGHAHARDFALRFLENMLGNLDNLFARQSGANREAYRIGFLAGLGFFEANPAYRGE